VADEEAEVRRQKEKGKRKKAESSKQRGAQVINFRLLGGVAGAQCPAFLNGFLCAFAPLREIFLVIAN
jgi:hypothetical protein